MILPLLINLSLAPRRPIPARRPPPAASCHFPPPTDEMSRLCVFVASLAMVRAYSACDLGAGTQASPVNATQGKVEGNFIRSADWVGTDWGASEEWSWSAPGCAKGCVSFNIMCTRAGSLRMRALLKIMCPGGDCDQSNSAWVSIDRQKKGPWYMHGAASDSAWIWDVAQNSYYGE